jgi:hypothetical protein
MFSLCQLRPFILCSVVLAKSIVLQAAENVPSNLVLAPFTMTAGGSVTMPLSFDQNDHFLARLVLEPEFGIFVVKGLELAVQLRYSTNIYTDVKDEPVGYPARIGGGIRARYFFDTGTRFFPFIGLGGGVDKNIYIKELPLFTLDVPIGVLIAINSNVAVHIGAPIRTYIGTGTAFHPVEVMVGYLGLQAYF